MGLLGVSGVQGPTNRWRCLAAQPWPLVRLESFQNASDALEVCETAQQEGFSTSA